MCAFIEKWLRLLRAPLLLPLLHKRNDLEIKKSDIVYILEKAFEVVAAELVDLAQEMLSHSNIVADALIAGCPCSERLDFSEDCLLARRVSGSPAHDKVGVYCRYF